MIRQLTLYPVRPRTQQGTVENLCAWLNSGKSIRFEFQNDQESLIFLLPKYSWVMSISVLHMIIEENKEATPGEHASAGDRSERDLLKPNHAVSRHLQEWLQGSAELEEEAGPVWQLIRAHRGHEALRLASRKLEEQPGNQELQVLTAICLRRTRSPQPALALLRDVLNSSPEHIAARYHYASALLDTGEWSEGFAELDKVQMVRSPAEKEFFTEPDRYWTGQPLEGKHLIIIGSGDPRIDLAFCRFIPKLQNLSKARIGLVCDREVVELMRTMREINRVDNRRFEPFDYFLPIERLPFLLGITRESLPGLPVPYLLADARRLNAAKVEFQSQKPIVGISWRAAATGDAVSVKGDSRLNASLNEARSLPLDFLSDLLESLCPRFEVLSLQNDLLPEESSLLDQFGVRVLEDNGLSDYASAATVITGLDFVVSVDSVIAHLAGAIGKRCHVLLPYCADWIWTGAEDGTSLYYPSATVYRQRSEDDWSLCIPPLVSGLENEAASQGIRLNAAA